MTSRKDFDWLAAVHTPFDSSGELALGCIEAQAENLISQGVDGAFVCGSTGESLSLSVDERKSVAERWSEVTHASELSLWVHVGANALPDACELARSAAALGADAICLMPPCFFRPADEQQLAEWCAAINAASGGLPMTYYETPDMSGMVADMRVFVSKVRRLVPNFKGIKYTVSDPELFSQLVLEKRPSEGMWWGRDEELISGLRAGASGAIGSTYNFAGRVYGPILDMLDGGSEDAAEEAQARSVRMVDVIASYGYFGAAKAVMGFLGVPVGPARMPLGNPSPDESKRLRRELDDLGFFDWVSA